MSEPIRIRIAVQKDGNSSVEVNGVKGSGCQAMTAGLERAMGDVAEETLTPEFHEESHEYEPETAYA